MYIGTMFCLVVKYLMNENGEEKNELDIESGDNKSQNTNNANLLDLSSLRGPIQNEMNNEILYKGEMSFDFNRQTDINDDGN